MSRLAEGVVRLCLCSPELSAPAMCRSRRASSSVIADQLGARHLVSSLSVQSRDTRMHGREGTGSVNGLRWMKDRGANQTGRSAGPTLTCRYCNDMSAATEGFGNECWRHAEWQLYTRVR